MRLLALFLAALLLATPLRAGTETVTLEFGGLEREFLLTVPDDLDTPAPLVLVLHGIIETGTAMRDHVTERRFDVLAERYGFVVAYPSAHMMFWSPGQFCGRQAPGPSRDDLAFLKSVIETVRDRVPIDPRRIFSTGFSQGGLMSLALACDNPGLIRAVGSVAMTLPLDLAADCARHPPDGVLFIHGTEDWVVPVDCGEIGAGQNHEVPLMSLAQSLEHFRRAKHCTGTGETRVWNEKDDGTTVTRTAWYSCRPGALEGYSVEGMGHRWPAGGPALPVGAVLGRTTQEIDGAAAIWGFFSRFK